MSKLVHGIVEFSHVDLIVTRDRGHQNLLCLRVDRHHHVYIASAFFIDGAIDVYTRNDKVERMLGDIGDRALILNRAAAEER